MPETTETETPVEPVTETPDPVEPVPDKPQDNEKYMRDLRKEAADNRAKAKELAAQLQKIEDAEKTELEKVTARAEQAEKARDEAAGRADEALLRAAVIAEATKQNAVDPDAVLTLLGNDQVEVTEDGEVNGAKEAIAGLLEAKPYLVGKTSAGPSGGGIRQPVEEQTLDQQIRAAEQAGDWATAGALKTQKLAAVGS